MNEHRNRLKPSTSFFSFTTVQLFRKQVAPARTVARFAECRNNRRASWKIRLNRISPGTCSVEILYMPLTIVYAYAYTLFCRVLVTRGRSRLCQGLHAYIPIDEAMQVACPTLPDARGRAVVFLFSFHFFIQRRGTFLFAAPDEIEGRRNSKGRILYAKVSGTRVSHCRLLLYLYFCVDGMSPTDNPGLYRRLYCGWRDLFCWLIEWELYWIVFGGAIIVWRLIGRFFWRLLLMECIQWYDWACGEVMAVIREFVLVYK